MRRSVVEGGDISSMFWLVKAMQSAVPVLFMARKLRESIIFLMTIKWYLLRYVTTLRYCLLVMGMYSIGLLRSLIIVVSFLNHDVVQAMSDEEKHELR